MNNELLAFLSEDDLNLPEFYPLNLAIAWVAYKFRPITIDYAQIIYDCSSLDTIDTAKYKEAERAIHLLLRAGKIESRYCGCTDHWHNDYFSNNGWKVFNPIEWNGAILGKSSCMSYFDEEEQISISYHNIEIKLADLLKIYPLEKISDVQLSKNNKIKTEKPFLPKEKEALLKILLGLALTNYTYDPKASRTSTAREITDDLKLHGISVDEDTVRKWLTQAKEYLPPDWNKEA